MGRRPLVRLLGAIATALAIAATPVAAQPGPQSAPLTIAGYRSINTFNPTNMGQAWQVEFGVGETLMTMRPDGTPVPALLESLESISPTAWRLTLKPGITFQNGSPLDANKLAAFLEYQSANSTLAGAQLAGLRATAEDELTVVMTTQTPDSVVPRKLVQHNAFVVYDVDAVLAAGKDEAALASSGYMTGPFKVASSSDRDLVLVRNETYWQGTPPLPGVTVLVIPDEQARLAAVRAGEADWALLMPVEYGPLLEKDPQARLIQAEWESAIRLELNQAAAPLDQIAVRRAFSLAIDYREIAEDAMAGYMATASGLFPLAFEGALANQTTDKAEAARLLDAAGWRVGADGVRARNGQKLAFSLLATGSRADHITIALSVAQQVADVGIKVDVRQVEAVGDIALSDTNWGAAVVSNGTLSQWSGSYETQLVRYHLGNSVQNYGRTADPELDALAAAMAEEFDPARKLDQFRRLQDIMVTEKAYLIAVVMQRPSLVVGKRYFDYRLSNWFRHLRWDTAPGN